MLIHKIFHLHQPLAQARETLRDLPSFQSSENGVEITCTRLNPHGRARLEFKTRQAPTLGTIGTITTEIEEIPSQAPNQILFRSAEGGVELAGMLELFPIRQHLTEAVLTVDYGAVSSLQKAIEAMSMALERFVNRQLIRIEHARSAAVPNPAL
jgi:hypothetical protein